MARSNRERPGQVALAEKQQTDTPIGFTGSRDEQSPRQSGALLPPGYAPPNVPSSAWHSARWARDSTAGNWAAKALAAPRPVEERRGLLEAVDGPTIVALALVGYAEVLDTPAPAGHRR